MALLSSNLRSLIEARLGGVGGRRLRRGLGGGGRQGLREPEGPRGGRGGGRGGGVHPAGDVDWLGLGPNLGCRSGASGKGKCREIVHSFTRESLLLLHTFVTAVSE